MKRLHRFAAQPRLFLLAAAIVAAPFASHGHPTLHRAPAVSAPQVSITVENQNFKDAEVYAVWTDGQRYHLGLSTGNTTKTYTTEYRNSGDLSVEVDFIAGGDYLSEPIMVNPNEEVHITIPPSAN